MGWIREGCGAVIDCLLGVRWGSMAWLGSVCVYRGQGGECGLQARLGAHVVAPLEPISSDLGERLATAAPRLLPRLCWLSQPFAGVLDGQLRCFGLVLRLHIVPYAP